MREVQLEEEEVRRSKRGKQPAPQEDEETDEYMERPKQPLSFNEAESVFDRDTFNGINTEKNVFEKAAVFHTVKPQ